MEEIKKRKVSRIPYFLSAIITVGMAGFMVSWSYFRDDLGALFPSWSEAQLSLPFSLHNITVLLSTIIIGPIMKKVSARVVFACGGLVLLIGFGLFPILPLDNPGLALVLLIVLFGFIAAFSPPIGSIATLDTFQPWFPDHVGLVSGLWLAIKGVAPILIGVYLGFLIPRLGVLKAVQVLGITLCALIFLALIYAKKPGPDIDLPAASIAPSSDSYAELTVKQMLLTSAFFHVYFFNVLGRCAGLIISDLGGTIANDMGIPTLAGLLFAPATALSCILGGYFADRFTLSNLVFHYCIVLFGSGIALALGGSMDNVPLVLLGIFASGYAYGGTTIVAATTARYAFGNKHYAQNLSVILTSVGFTAPAIMLSGNMLTNSGGSYEPIYIFILIMGAVSIIDALIMIKTKSFANISKVLERTKKSKEETK